MFDNYIEHQGPDDARRQRLILALLAAAALSSFGFASMATLERFQVDRVEAPHSRIEVVDFVFVPPPPPEDPPPPVPEDEPAAAQSESAAMAVPEEDPPPDVNSASDPDLLTQPRKRTPPGIPKTCPPGVVCRDGAPGLTGIPKIGAPISGCVGPGCCIGPNCNRKSTSKPPAPVTFESLECRRCPNPDPARLRQAVAARGQRGGTNRTEFCVDTSGKTYNVRTKRGFGDSQVDAVCRATVQGWRFTPPRIDGQVRKTCSSVRFDIHFD